MAKKGGKRGGSSKGGSSKPAAKKPTGWQKQPKRTNAVGPEAADEPDAQAEAAQEVDAAPRSRYGLLKLTKDSKVSRLRRLDRLQRVRAERAVARGRERLSNYIPPPPEPTEEERAAARRSDPSTWQLRGAARPWEEVEAAKTRDHHEVGYDALARHGPRLAAEIPEGARWVQALADLARDEAGRGRLDAALALCVEALTHVRRADIPPSCRGRDVDSPRRRVAATPRRRRE